MEREDVPRHGSRTFVALAFADFQAFSEWCDRDRTRFDVPLLQQQVLRAAEALWLEFS